MRWLLGRVVEVHPDEDGIVRVATIRTSFEDVYKHNVKCLSPLPNNDAA